ncbi:uncharacterized protein E6C27_scaffold274G00760 [Cucumis melo var. makuwa]|uniref:Uncharacterized protein n=1 Tax=Cucumis melo var. makuwa TaxID=1194695 RepID=A0A5A7UPK3_CUCMM|nr:uncharacterized protein E6C27_scaffold274G00760 [Cucumis melo var. makuwa]
MPHRSSCEGCCQYVSFSLPMVILEIGMLPDEEQSATLRPLEQNEEHVDEVHCSRERSRKAWNIIEEHLLPFMEIENYESHGKCLADLCGALHCDLKMDIKSRKSKCKPAAAARNKHLCESLADSCFPINEGPSANRLHELFLHQFCGAHSCTGKQKPFSRGAARQPGIFYMASSILILMLLPIFYVIVYLHRRESRNGIEVLKRISKAGRKSKPL